MNAPLRWTTPGDDELAHALRPKLERVEASRGRAQRDEIAAWLEMLQGEDRHCALAVAQRLDQILGELDAGGLARWILGGLRRYGNDVAAQRAWFRLEDPRSVEALHGEAAAGGELESALPSLGLLLAGLAGAAGADFTVQPRRQPVLNAPPLRPVVAERHLLLPDSYTVLDAPDRYRLYCAAVAHAVAHLRFSPLRQPADTLKPMGIAVVSAIEDARVERLLARELHGVRRWFQEFLRGDVAPGDLRFAALASRMDRALADPDYPDDNHWVNKARELFHAAERSHGLEDYAAFRRLAAVLANDLGQMRVRFAAQQYSVAAPYRDDNSCLWDFGDPREPDTPAQELQVQGVAIERRRVDEPAGAADAPVAGDEEETGRYAYPEWDYRIQLERADWCTVIESVTGWRVRAGASGDPRLAALAPLPLARARRLSRRRRLRRQWEGDDIDLDSAIEVVVDRRMELAPDARFFVRPGKEPRRSSVIVLLDLSESANDRIGGTMRSILDMEKEAALLLVRSVRQGPDRIAVHGFCSDTRQRVRYRRLLDFDAPLDATGTARILSAQAALSTRMGAALRHAASGFGDRHSGRRAVIVVTDGAPSDIDVHDPEYLVEDAREAVRAAARAQVDCYCVAVDSAADAYVRRIYGWRNYRVVDAPETLPAHLASLYARLAAR